LPCPFRAVSDKDLPPTDDDVESESLVVETTLDDAAGERAGHAKGGSETRIVVRVVATPWSLAGDLSPVRSRVKRALSH
jgi:hypothetical protein